MYVENNLKTLYSRDLSH